MVHVDVHEVPVPALGESEALVHLKVGAQNETRDVEITDSDLGAFHREYDGEREVLPTLSRQKSGSDDRRLAG
ncbi:hypothetical protein [Sorangium sp. So ce1024]|uniref:hypothetical protein n=1 Tax=Sorangium sp. So ce1024 TaxID=3133327 RepID=UPI003EFDB4CE